jgi:hypothetical protein
MPPEEVGGVVMVSPVNSLFFFYIVFFNDKMQERPAKIGESR